MSTNKRGKYNSKQNIILLLYNFEDLEKKYCKIKIVGLSNSSIIHPKDMWQRICKKKRKQNTILMPFLYKRHKVRNLDFYLV